MLSLFFIKGIDYNLTLSFRIHLGGNMYKVNEVSKISGVSVRTLHHYDKINLLSPKRKENDYRYYTEEDMERLQTILFYKYFGFSLKEIQELLEKEDMKVVEHLKEQLILLKKEEERLKVLIETLRKTIDSKERKVYMSVEEKFKGFTMEDSKKYRESAIDAYGKDVIDKADKKQKGKEQKVVDGFNEIFFSFSDNMSSGLKAEEKENIELAKRLHQHLCTYAFDCSLEVFSNIGYGYVRNPEFKANLDKFKEGLAQYVCDAIQSYTNS